jgi:hypothetical protein
VAAIVAHATRPPGLKDPPSAEIAENANVLMSVLEFDALISRGESPERAIATLGARWGARNSSMLAHLAALQGMTDSGPQLREVRLSDVVPGMILMDDLRTDLGTLLVSQGYEISHSFIDRIRNFGPGLLEGRVRVRLARS